MPNLTDAQKAYNAAQAETFAIAAWGHHRYFPRGESLTDEGKRQESDYNNRIRTARDELEAALLRLVAEHGETYRTLPAPVVGWLRTLADDPAELSLLAVRPDERDFDTEPTAAEPAEAHPAEHSWAAELYDPLADEWVPGTRYNDRDRAVRHLNHARSIGPVWNDGTPVQRRLVRSTTTYTVEQPTAEAQQPKEA